MKWLPGGWQRADAVDRDRSTTPVGNAPEQPTRQHAPARDAPEQATRQHAPARGAPRATKAAPNDAALSRSVLLSEYAHDVDISASNFRNLLVGGGLSGLVTVLCAASLVNDSSSVWLWIWQIVFGVLFLWFLRASRGMLSSRGFLFDTGGFYARTRGEVFGIAWEEITAIGVGSLPWVEHRRPVSPERRHALELYPSDDGFAARHPELERWAVEEPAPMPGLPMLRYRFHLPPFSRLSSELEGAVQDVAPRKWIGRYRRQSPPPA